MIAKPDWRNRFLQRYDGGDMGPTKERMTDERNGRNESIRKE